MSQLRYLAFLLLALLGLCFGVKASAEVAAPADTTYLLFDYQRSPRMERMRDFAPRFKAYLARPYEELGFKNRPKNKGWLSLRPVWKGQQDSLELPLFVYETGAVEPKEMLLFYVERIDTLFTPPPHYTPMATFAEAMEKVWARAAYFDKTLYVVTRDYRGRMLRHQVTYVLLRAYVYRGHDMCVMLHTWDELDYERKNIFARVLFPRSISREEHSSDKELYRQLLRYGFLSEALPLGPYFTF